MELSEALLTGVLKFDIQPNPEGGGRFLPFQGVVQKIYGEGNSADAFPLAFACPLFTGTVHDFTAFVVASVPEDYRPPNKPNVVFVCDFIDALSVRAGWDEKQMGEWVKTIEQWQDKHKLTRRGQAK